MTSKTPAKPSNPSPQARIQNPPCPRRQPIRQPLPLPQDPHPDIQPIRKQRPARLQEKPIVRERHVPVVHPVEHPARILGHEVPGDVVHPLREHQHADAVPRDVQLRTRGFALPPAAGGGLEDQGIEVGHDGGADGGRLDDGAGGVVD